MNEKQKIVDIIRVEYEKVRDAYMRAHAERVGLEHAEKAWDYLMPEDSIDFIPSNPYSSNLPQALKKEEQAKIEFKAMENVYKVAVSTFLAQG